uniref:(northern house mosquito) hypothetical protein n=1 Tax=Culex pipiens TaxID=7175 RepID=A0A8D8AYY6_CULPI
MISLKSVPPEPLTIDDLPDEILDHIFSFLKLPDRKSASLVCHRWNNKSFRWKNVVVVVQTSQLASEYSSLLASDRPYKHLEIPARWLGPEMAARFANSLESLVLFRLEAESVMNRNAHFSIFDVEDIHNAFPKIRELTLEYLTFLDHSHFDRFIRVSFPALESLYVKHCLIGSRSIGIMRFSNFSNLEHLKIETKFPLESTLLQDVEMLPKLRALDLNCPEFRIRHLGQHFHLNHITSLAIEAQFNEGYLLAIVNLFPALLSLRLKGSTQFSAESIETAKKRLPNCVFKFEYHLNRVQEYRNEFYELY